MPDVDDVAGVGGDECDWVLGGWGEGSCHFGWVGGWILTTVCLLVLFGSGCDREKRGVPLYVDESFGTRSFSRT